MKEDFLSYLDTISSKLDNLFTKRTLIISSLNEDGLAASTLLFKYLLSEGTETHLTFVQHINKDKLLSLIKKYEDYDNIVTIDFGSYFIDALKNISKNIIVIDHHYITSKEKKVGNVYQINPRIFGIDGTREVSSSTIMFLLLKNLGFYDDDVVFLSLLGPIGDLQDSNELKGINKEVLQELIEKDIITIKKGLRLFGLASKPLYKAIELSLELYIPEITGNESKSIELLRSLKIPLKSKGRYTTYFDLSEDHLKKLVSEIIKLRLKNNIENAEKVLTDLYIINKEDLIFRELHEIDYIFLASAIYNRPSNPILYFLGDKSVIDNLQDLVINFKKNILEIMKIIYSEKNLTLDQNGIFLLDITGLNVPPQIVTALSRILYLSSDVPTLKKTKLYVVYAQTDNGVYLSIKPKYQSFLPLSKVVYKMVTNHKGEILTYDMLGGLYFENMKFDNIFKNLKVYLRQENLI